MTRQRVAHAQVHEGEAPLQKVGREPAVVEPQECPGPCSEEARLELVRAGVPVHAGWAGWGQDFSTVSWRLRVI